MLQERVTPSKAGDEQFEISAFFSLQERRPRILKKGDGFAVIDPKGDFLSGFGSSDGFFFQDTRYISHYELLVGSVRPIPICLPARSSRCTMIPFTSIAPSF